MEREELQNKIAELEEQHEEDRLFVEEAEKLLKFGNVNIICSLEFVIRNDNFLGSRCNTLN